MTTAIQNHTGNFFSLFQACDKNSFLYMNANPLHLVDKLINSKLLRN